MLALREAEHANLELPAAKRQSWAAFGRSRALESTATGTMLSARRSRFFASGDTEITRKRTNFSGDRGRTPRAAGAVRVLIHSTPAPSDSRGVIGSCPTPRLSDNCGR
ncbi:unnamed protein product [Coccothraustes coccothraustes]